MARAKITLQGLMTADSTIFDTFVIPAELDKVDCVNAIELMCSSLEILYPNPTLLKKLIAAWSKIQLPVWEQLYETTQYEYNPIENYNRTEVWGEKRTGKANTINTNTRNTTHHDNAGFSSDEDASGNSATVTNSDNKIYMLGFNSPVEVLNEHTVDTSTSTNTAKNNTRNRSSSNSTIDENEDTSFISNQNDDNSIGHQGRVHGNIGVTTTQNMIDAQRNVVKFNIYEYIASEFKKRFCILVY